MSEQLRVQLKAARAKLGMSQAQFARHLDLPFRTLQSWEMNRNTPHSFALRALEAKLGQILAEN